MMRTSDNAAMRWSKDPESCIAPVRSATIFRTEEPSRRYYEAASRSPIIPCCRKPESGTLMGVGPGLLCDPEAGSAGDTRPPQLMRQLLRNVQGLDAQEVV